MLKLECKLNWRLYWLNVSGLKYAVFRKKTNLLEAINRKNKLLQVLDSLNG